MAWSDAARRAARLARKAKAQYSRDSKMMRLVASRSSIQDFRNKLWKKSTNTVRGQAQTHLRRPKWAMRGDARKRRI